MGHAAKVGRLLELWDAGQIDGEEAEAFFDPEVEWLEPPETIGRNVVTGPDAARAALKNWNDQFDSLRVETLEMREEGDRVLHAMHQFARAGGSDVEIEGDLFMVGGSATARPYVWRCTTRARPGRGGVRAVSRR